MIAFVAGRVAGIAPDAVVVEVGGVGLAVRCAPAALARLGVGERTHLATSLVVREDALTLYGFVDEDERDVFELLQTASGVGPRLALAMIAAHGSDGLRRAVAGEDLAALTRVPGIGKKGAQRIVLELKDRLGAPAGLPARADGVQRGSPWRGQLHTALAGLGWSSREADEALAAVAPEADAALAEGRSPDVSVLLRSALRSLNRS
ncbi:MAG: Holliday junction branch migration protein RuvA [Streptomycetales bacterium]